MRRILGDRRCFVDDAKPVRPASPQNLAVFRVAALALLLVSPEPREAIGWSELAPALRVVPEGLGLATTVLPISPRWALAALLVFYLSAVSGLVGFCTRASLLAAMLSGLYVFALRQLSGSVTHDMHLFWFTALLAASPSGDALSVDAWLARRRGEPAPAPSLAYAVPLWAARLLLGVIYFFPGFWKLSTSGLAWFWSDNLRNQMYWKWYEMGVVPVFRIDHFPWLCRLGALFSVMFELSFLPLMVSRKGRVVAAASGLLFHLFAQVFLKIPFLSLWGCYVVLIDWRRGQEEPEPAPARARDVVPAVVLGIGLLTGAIVQGARGAMQAWPFACYPTFQWMAPAEIPDLLVEARWEDGHTVVVPEAGVRSQERWGMVWGLAGMYGRRPSEAQLRAYLGLLAQQHEARAALEGAVAASFFRVFWSVVPEDRGKPPLRRALLGEVALEQSPGLIER
jgi:hypothetical protein